MLSTGLHFASESTPSLALASLAQGVGDLARQRLLDDQAQHQVNQIASPCRRPQISVHQGAKLLARPLRRG
jgi:hypothetical protein